MCASIRGYASYERARGFGAKPASQTIALADFLPLDTLTGAVTYPEEIKQVTTFYKESEKLVRFLSVEDKQKFLVFLDAMSKGNKFDTALSKAFGGRFMSVNALEVEFKIYAARSYETAIRN